MKDRVSSLLHKIPADLGTCMPAPSDKEAEDIVSVRRRYCKTKMKNAAEIDKVRAFRLLRGAKRYLEIGTFDKYNLAYVSSLCDPAALLVDLDIEDNPEAEAMLRAELQDAQTYVKILGDSSKDATLQAVLDQAGTDPFDAVFIDANHMAPYAMSDFAMYGELVSPTGYVFFHDIKFEGHKNNGVADALDVLQRFVPVYEVVNNEPVTHWHRPLSKRKTFWGGVAIIRGEDLHARL
jgi:predicted O-methyltransferase YrrM